MNGKKCKWEFQCVRARWLYMRSVWYNCHRFFSLISLWFSSRWIFFSVYFMVFAMDDSSLSIFSFIFIFWQFLLQSACVRHSNHSICLALIFNTFATPQSAFFLHQNNSIDCWYRPIHKAIDMVLSREKNAIFLMRI